MIALVLIVIIFAAVYYVCLAALSIALKALILAALVGLLGFILNRDDYRRRH